MVGLGSINISFTCERGLISFMVEIHFYHLIRLITVEEVTIDVLSHDSLDTFMLFSSYTVKCG